MKRLPSARWFIVLLIVVLTVIRWASAQITITVTDFSDTGAPSTCPGPTCTLREALSIAGSGDTITFAGSGTIFVNSSGGLGELPALASGDVTIEAGGNAVIIDGSASPDVLTYGLLITSDNNTVLGLDIRNFDGDGIVISSGNGNQIGGDGLDEGNVIHLNGGDGIVLDAAGTAADPNTIVGNLIGTDPLGNSVDTNGGVGIRVTNGSDSNIIGGSTATSENVISGNDGGGIIIDGSDNTTIEGNRIGLDGSIGVIGLGNGTLVGDAGILVTNGSTGTLITDNAIAASSGDGIYVVNSTDTSIVNNNIGVDDAFGTIGVGNGNLGVHVFNSPTTAITDNTIADNPAGGVLLEAGTSGSTITGNRIGLGSDGETLLGNGSNGVRIADSDLNTVGSNLVADTTGDGIEISGAGATGNLITGNQIGLTASGGVAGNSADGVLVSGGASGNTIDSNTVANSGGDGVDISVGSDNTISGNAIFDNDELGIELQSNGVTLNDLGDGDSGPNGLQNFPVLMSALTDGITTAILGTLNSEFGATYLIEFFSNTVCDSSLHGEGETPLGTMTVTTDGSGNAAISTSLAGATLGEFITATATNVDTGSTSEFSLCIPVLAAPPIAAFVAIPTIGVAPLTVSFTDLSIGVITTWLWDFGDGSTSSAQNPGHIYTVPGIYTVTLTVTGPGGTDTITGTITVLAPSATPTNTNTPVGVPPQASAIPSFTPTASDTPTPSTPSATPTRTLTPTRTATVTPSLTVTFTATPSRTPSSTPSRTATASLTPTQTVTRTPTATVTASRTATATVTLTSTPPSTSTATATLTLTVTPTVLPELTVVKVTDESGFDITIHNAGQGAVSRLQMSEALRPGVRYISSRPGSPVCVEDAGLVFCNLNTLAAGDETTVDFTVSTDGTDPASGRTIITSDGATLTIIDQPYLLKIGDPPIAGPGTAVTYTLRVINPTDDVARQVRIEDMMPEAIEILSATASAGIVRVEGQQVVFTQARLEAGGRTTITLLTRVRADGDFNQIVNQACLTSAANQLPSCAEMRFLRAGEIPATGETPGIRTLLLTIAGLSVLLYLGRSLVRRAHQL